MEDLSIRFESNGFLPEPVFEEAISLRVVLHFQSTWRPQCVVLSWRWECIFALTLHNKTEQLFKMAQLTWDLCHCHKSSTVLMQPVFVNKQSDWAHSSPMWQGLGSVPLKETNNFPTHLQIKGKSLWFFSPAKRRLLINYSMTSILCICVCVILTSYANKMEFELNLMSA